MSPVSRAIVDAEQAAWITQGAVSVSVASRDASLRPSIGQAHGCRVAPTRERVTVFLHEPSNRALVVDLRSSGIAAVVFTHSASTRSLQVKARDAREVPLLPGDHDRIAAHVGALARQWATQGMPEPWTRALFDPRGGAIVAFELEPYVAFEQTPGPRAGTPCAGALLEGA